MMNPWPKHWMLKVLAGIWSFPVMALAFLFVVLPLWIGRQIGKPGWSEGAWEWTVTTGSRLQRASAWVAFSMGWAVVYLTDDVRKDARTRIHERVHLRQQLILSLAHWIFYGLFCVVVWVACRSLHAYSASPFELDARMQAGEQVGNLGPRADDDRWPWW